MRKTLLSNQTGQGQPKAQRKSYLDFLRIAAIYMVLFNHTNERGFVLFTVARNSPLYGFYLFNAILIKIAVPLFFMISGALLLDREETIRELLTKRFLRFFVDLLVASLLSYLYCCFRRSASLEFSWQGLVRNLYNNSTNGALWYLYAYLAYLLMLPFLRRLARHMTNREYLWMVLLYGCMECLSIVEFLIWKGAFGHNGNFSFFISGSYVFYPLMGYFMEKRLKAKNFNRKNMFILILSSIAAILICCGMTQYRCTLLNVWDEDSVQTFFSTLIFLPTITVFYVAKMWFDRHTISERHARRLAAIGGTTFGIYLVDFFWKDRTFFVFRILQPVIHTLPACWAWVLTACCLGSVVVYLLKKIPLIRKLI